ncbi:EAL domain-containing protein [Bacillus sp. JJ1532]|uniref:sensor domain-containing protein n=1 Tax=unclassified Bacillus (in: firmicutes) TaxID=185979 RepID=UPI0030009A41
MAGMFEENQVQPWINSLKELFKIGHKNYQSFLGMEKDIQEISSFLEDYSNLKFALDVSAIVAVTNIKGEIIYANNKFCELSKYSREELIGKDHRILNSGHHDKQFFKNMWTSINKGEVWEGEVKNKAKDGSFYWVKTTIVPLKDLSGKTTMFIAIRTDISEGKFAQEKLLTALQNDYQQIVASMNNLIFKVAKDHDHYVYTLNEGQLANKLGLENGNMKNKKVHEIFPKEITENLIQYYHQAFLGRQVTYQYPFRGRQILTHLTPIYEHGEIKEILGCMNDITELHHAQQQVEYMAYHDILSSLPNRRKFSDDLNHLISISQSRNERIALLYLDLDRFKQINDSFGHAVGDQLITKVSFLLKKALFQKAQIYRFAGDEFIILYPKINDYECAIHSANQILSIFDQSIMLLNNLEIFTSCSIGISIFPDHGDDCETLLKNADAAMYRAKSKGRNTFNIYEKDMSHSQEKALSIEYHLRNAIENDEFELYFQPKMNLVSKEINGIEALIRWNNPDLGKLSPDDFIPTAEETGFIHKLDKWVLEKACKQNKEWNETLFSKPVKVSVNISPLHFRLPNFHHVIKQVLDKTELAPHLLEIEITENSFIDHAEECISCLNELRKMGVTVAIDDFGKGYSSLNYLRKFPIHSLKIDRTFIQEVAKNSDDIAIVKAITLLAHELNLKVVAEGIETEEVIHILEKIGCDEIQGYYISKPLPKQEFETVFSL